MRLNIQGILVCIILMTMHKQYLVVVNECFNYFNFSLFQIRITKILNPPYISISDSILYCLHGCTSSSGARLLAYVIICWLEDPQWLSRRVVDFRSTDPWFETHWRHCVVFLRHYILSA